MEYSPASARVPTISYWLPVQSSGWYAVLLVQTSYKIFFFFKVYIAAIVGLEGGVGNIVSRSLLSRLVPQDELGKIYGLLAILDALLPYAGTL